MVCAEGGGGFGVFFLFVKIAKKPQQIKKCLEKLYASEKQHLHMLNGLLNAGSKVIQNPVSIK